MLRIAPTNLAKANAYVALYHRHHGRTQGQKFSIAVKDEDGSVRGVAIVGRPVGRSVDDGMTLEVLRVCTDGTPNVCSMLYGASRRAAWAMGYDRIVTYTLEEEPGTSLRAAGWVLDGVTSGDTWARPGRSRVDRAPTGPKRRWVSTRG